MGRILFCLVLSLFLCISCTSVDERSFFNFPVSDIGTDVPHRNLDVGNDTLAGIMASDCIVRDTVIIALSRTGYLYCIDMDGNIVRYDLSELMPATTV